MAALLHLVSQSMLLGRMISFLSLQGEKTAASMGRMYQAQFRNLLSAARVINSRLTPERVDEIFTNVATAQLSLDRKVTQSPDSGLLCPHGEGKVLGVNRGM